MEVLVITWRDIIFQYAEYQQCSGAHTKKIVLHTKKMRFKNLPAIYLPLPAENCKNCKN